MWSPPPSLPLTLSLTEIDPTRVYGNDPQGNGGPVDRGPKGDQLTTMVDGFRHERGDFPDSATIHTLSPCKIFQQMERGGGYLGTGGEQAAC